MSAARGRVLVIDDEALVGRAIARALRPHHEVTLETNARNALSRLLSNEVFDAVVCDLMMPEMSGMTLYSELSQSRPAMSDRVLFMTGGAYTPASEAFVAGRGDRCITKPIDPADLLARLAIVLKDSSRT